MVGLSSMLGSILGWSARPHDEGKTGVAARLDDRADGRGALTQSGEAVAVAGSARRAASVVDDRDGWVRG
ncbi:hypothetical protein ABH936_001836 [Dermacoccus sp. GAS27A]